MGVLTLKKNQISLLDDIIMRLDSFGKIEAQEGDVYFITQALYEACEAVKFGNRGIGAVLAKENIILAKGSNGIKDKNNFMRHVAHAEIMAMHNYSQKLGYSPDNLLNTTMYTTLEPCIMCACSMLHLRVGEVVTAIPAPNSGAILTHIDALKSMKAWKSNIDKYQIKYRLAKIPNELKELCLEIYHLGKM